MERERKIWNFLVALLVVTLGIIGLDPGSISRVALAQSGGGYDLTWNTIGSGGAIGQPDAGTIAEVMIRSRADSGLTFSALALCSR